MYLIAFREMFVHADNIVQTSALIFAFRFSEQLFVLLQLLLVHIGNLLNGVLLL
jgi:hypothetical protein